MSCITRSNFIKSFSEAGGDSSLMKMSRNIFVYNFSAFNLTFSTDNPVNIVNNIIEACSKSREVNHTNLFPECKFVKNKKSNLKNR